MVHEMNRDHATSPLAPLRARDFWTYASAELAQRVADAEAAVREEAQRAKEDAIRAAAEAARKRKADEIANERRRRMAGSIQSARSAGNGKQSGSGAPSSSMSAGTSAGTSAGAGMKSNELDAIFEIDDRPYSPELL